MFLLFALSYSYVLEAQEVCADADCDFASLCGIFSVTANNPVNELGYYPPATVFDVCFTANSYENIGGNWLHGIVPVLGPGWQGFAQGADPGISCGGGCDWTWNTFGVIGTGVSAVTINQPGWFVESETTGADMPPSLPNDPGDNWGDSSIDGETFCFTATAAPEGPACLEDLTFQLQFYTDSETGSHESEGCSFAPLVYDLSIQCCPVFVVANSGETICTGGDFQPDINIYEPLMGTYNIVWSSNPPDLVFYLTDPTTLPPTLNIPYGAASGPVSFTAEITDGGCGLFTEVLNYTVEDAYFELPESTCVSYFEDGVATYENLTIVAGENQTSGGNYEVNPTANVNLATGTIFGVGLMEGSYTVGYTSPSGCLYETSFSVNASPTPTAAFSYSPAAICAGESSSPVLPPGTALGGTYAIASPVNAASVDPMTGEFSLNGAPAGEYTISYTTTPYPDTGFCSGTMSSTLMVQNNSGFSYPSSLYCDNDLFSDLPLLDGPSPDQPFSISSPGVIDPLTGVINLMASGAGDFTVTLGGDCGQSVQMSILESATASINLVGSNALCPGDPPSQILLEVSGGSPLYQITYIDFDGTEAMVSLTGDSFMWTVEAGTVGDFMVQLVEEANGCVSNVDLEVSMAGCACPSVDDYDLESLQVICDGDAFVGSVSVDPSTQINWYLDGTAIGTGASLSYNPAAVDCTTEYDLSVEVICADDGSLIFSETATAVLVADWQAEYDMGTCIMAISNLCDGMQASWDDGNASDIGNIYSAAEGTSGTVTWTVTQPAQPVAALPCLEDFVYNEPYSCAANCPNVLDYGVNSNVVCDGEALNFLVNADDMTGLEVLWTTASGSFTDPNTTLVFNSISGCQEQQSITCLITCLADGSTLVDDTFIVTVYGDVAAEIEVSDACTVNISQDCPEYTASWSDGSTGGSGFSADFQPGEFGQVIFTVDNAGAPSSCSDFAIIVDYDCAQDCPTLFSIDLDVQEICDGETIAGFANVSDESLATVIWTINGNTVDTFGWSDVFSSASGCSEEIVISAEVSCIADGSILGTENFIVTVYPPIDGVVVNGGCSALFLGDCPDYVVTWETSEESGTGSSYTAGSAEQGAVSFTASHPVGTDGCDTEVFLASYDCAAECPVFIGADSDADAYCNGDQAIYTIELDDENLGVITWISPDGSISQGPQISQTVQVDTDCPDDYLMQYEVLCSGDGSLISAGWVTVSVYPEVMLNINETGCSVAIESDCPDYVISWSDADGQEGSDDYTAAPGSSGNLDIAVAVPSAPTACSSYTFDATYDCPNDCPVLIDVAAAADAFCEGEPISLLAELSDSTQALINWILPGGENSDYFDLSYMPSGPIGCSQTFDFSYEILCLGDGNILGEGSLSVEVIGTLTYSVISTDCTIELSQDCANNTAVWTSDSSTGDGFVYEAEEGSTGAVEFVITNNSVECPETASVSIELDCGQICPSMIVGDLLDPMLILCDSASLDLSFFAAQVETDLPAASVFAWYDEAGDQITDVNQIIEHSGLTCEPELLSFSLEVNCVDDPNLSIDAGTVSVEIYPIPRAEWFGLTAPECSFVVNDSCSVGSLSIQYSLDGGATFGDESILPSDLSEGDEDVAMSVLIAVQGASPACELVGEYVITCPCDRPDAPEVGPSSLYSCDAINMEAFEVEEMAGLEIRWFNDEDEQVGAGPSFVPTIAGNYYAVYVGNEACPSFNSLEVSLEYGEVSEDFMFDYGTLTYTQNIDTDPAPVIAQVSGGSYGSVAGLEIDPVSGVIDLENSLAGVYEVVYISEDICASSFAQSITILPEPRPFVLIPNAFSPNGDGVNDVFKVIGSNIESAQLLLYNRWGELLFESSVIGEGWDGSYKGEAQELGVYVYIAYVKLLDGEEEMRHGNVTLIR